MILLVVLAICQQRLMCQERSCSAWLGHSGYEFCNTSWKSLEISGIFFLGNILVSGTCSAAHEMPMRPDQVYLVQCNLHDTFCTRNMSTRCSECVNECQRSPNTTPHVDVMRELILNDSLKLEQLRSAEVAVGQLGWVMTDIIAEPTFSISRTRPLHVLRILSRGGCCFKSDGHRTSRVVPSLQTGRLRLSWDSD